MEELEELAIWAFNFFQSYNSWHNILLGPVYLLLHCVAIYSTFHLYFPMGCIRLCIRLPCPLTVLVTLVSLEANFENPAGKPSAPSAVSSASCPICGTRSKSCWPCGFSWKHQGHFPLYWQLPLVAECTPGQKPVYTAFLITSKWLIRVIFGIGVLPQHVQVPVLKRKEQRIAWIETQLISFVYYLVELTSFICYDFVCLFFPYF